MEPLPDPHHRHRFPAALIGHAVWLYHVFSLSLRDVEPIPAERGVVVPYGSIRRLCSKFGQSVANKPRRRRPRPGDKEHLGEVFVRIRGKVHCFQRAAIRTGSCSTSWCRAGATRRRPSDSFASC